MSWSRRRAQRQQVEYLLQHDPAKLPVRRGLRDDEVVDFLHEMGRGNNSAFGLVKLSKLNLDQDIVADNLARVLVLSPTEGRGTATTSGENEEHGSTCRSCTATATAADNSTSSTTTTSTTSSLTSTFCKSLAKLRRRVARWPASVRTLLAVAVFEHRDAVAASLLRAGAGPSLFPLPPQLPAIEYEGASIMLSSTSAALLKRDVDALPAAFAVWVLHQVAFFAGLTKNSGRGRERGGGEREADGDPDAKVDALLRQRFEVEVDGPKNIQRPVLLRCPFRSGCGARFSEKEFWDVFFEPRNRGCFKIRCPRCRRDIEQSMASLVVPAADERAAQEVAQPHDASRLPQSTSASASEVISEVAFLNLLSDEAELRRKVSSDYTSGTSSTGSKGLLDVWRAGCLLFEKSGPPRKWLMREAAGEVLEKRFVDLVARPVRLLSKSKFEALPLKMQVGATTPATSSAASQATSSTSCAASTSTRRRRKQAGKFAEQLCHESLTSSRFRALPLREVKRLYLGSTRAQRTTELHKACEAGDVLRLHALVEAGCDLTAATLDEYSDHSPLFLSFYNNFGRGGGREEPEDVADTISTSCSFLLYMCGLVREASVKELTACWAVAASQGSSRLADLAGSVLAARGVGDVGGGGRQSCQRLPRWTMNDSAGAATTASTSPNSSRAELVANIPLLLEGESEVASVMEATSLSYPPSRSGHLLRALGDSRHAFLLENLPVLSRGCGATAVVLPRSELGGAYTVDGIFCDPFLALLQHAFARLPYPPEDEEEGAPPPAENGCNAKTMSRRTSHTQPWALAKDNGHGAQQACDTRDRDSCRSSIRSIAVAPEEEDGGSGDAKNLELFVKPAVCNRRKFFCDALGWVQDVLRRAVLEFAEIPRLTDAVFYPHMRFLYYDKPSSCVPAHVDLARTESSGAASRTSTHTFILYLHDCGAGGEKTSQNDPLQLHHLQSGVELGGDEPKRIFTTANGLKNNGKRHQLTRVVDETGVADDRNGGETVLLDALPGPKNQYTIHVREKVRAKRGRLFLFPHQCPHQGNPVWKPTKLLLRGEVLLKFDDQDHGAAAGGREMLTAGSASLGGA